MAYGEATTSTAGIMAPTDKTKIDNVNDPTTLPRCRATRTTNLSILDSTTTDITFPTEDYDVGSLHDIVTNTDRVTIPTGEDGIYGVAAGCGFATNATGQRSLSITVNGAVLNDSDKMSVDAASSSKTKLQVTSFLNLSAGDIVRAAARQNSGAALNVENAHLDVIRLA